MSFQNTANFARQLDDQDELRPFREEFIFPKHNGKDVIYFCGNSLGLQPKSAQAALQQELNDWAKYGVEGHFKAKNPWYSYHELLTNSSAKLVGAKPSEVVNMNGLTVNLHLLLVSFYRPKGRKFKILYEQMAFPSDQYALQSQVKFHGLDTEEALVEMQPREGEQNLRTEDIEAKIEELNGELALVLFGGVNYYTGQAFDMETITKAGHLAGALVGFDLAHAAGNLKLHLHDWQVDFACWCSYKYLNSGPGSVAGAFVHERHGNKPDLPRFAGWWGNDPDTRFQMEKDFVPAKGVRSWQLSNAPVFSMAVHKASLEIFDRAGMTQLRKKSKQLTAYLEFIIHNLLKKYTYFKGKIQIITPPHPEQRGCQLSLLITEKGKVLHEALTNSGIITDWREPDVIRMAPVPLYNSFMDVFHFGQVLENFLKENSG